MSWHLATAFLCFFFFFFFFESNILSKSFRHPKKKVEYGSYPKFPRFIFVHRHTWTMYGDPVGKTLKPRATFGEEKLPPLQIFKGRASKYMGVLGWFRVGDMGISRMQHGLRYEKARIGRRGHRIWECGGVEGWFLESRLGTNWVDRRGSLQTQISV